MAKKRKNAVERADVAVAEEASKLRDHPATKALKAFGQIGDQPPMFAICAATWAAGVVSEDRRLARAGARMMASWGLATLGKIVLKRVVARTRPHMMLDEGRYEVKAFGPNEGKWNSFPSGHTAGAVSAARALAREYPGAAPAAYAGAGGVAVAQIPSCAHYPSDIAAGAALGWVSELAVARLFDAAPSVVEGEPHRDARRRVEASRLL